MKKKKEEPEMLLTQEVPVNRLGMQTEGTVAASIPFLVL